MNLQPITGQQGIRKWGGGGTEREKIKTILLALKHLKDRQHCMAADLQYSRLSLTYVVPFLYKDVYCI